MVPPRLHRSLRSPQSNSQMVLPRLPGQIQQRTRWDRQDWFSSVIGSHLHWIGMYSIFFFFFFTALGTIPRCSRRLRFCLLFWFKHGERTVFWILSVLRLWIHILIKPLIRLISRMNNYAIDSDFPAYRLFSSNLGLTSPLPSLTFTCNPFKIA